MRCKTAALFLGVIGLQALGAQAVSQQPNQQPKIDDRAKVNSNVALHLVDGSVIFGVMERQDADSMVVVGRGGRMAFPTTHVRELRAAGTAHTRSNGTTEYWYANANTTRLFFGSTGRTLAK